VKRSAVRWFLFLLFAGVLFGVTGCESTEPENDSVRPWNSPQGWEGNGMPMMNQQHQ